MTRLLAILALASLGCGSSEPAQRPPPRPAPAPIADRREPEPEPPVPERPALAIDTHVDTPQRMLDAHDDIAERLEGGHLDMPRMREGGLSGAFFSVWVDPDDHPREAAWERALRRRSAPPPTRSGARTRPGRSRS